MVYLNTPYINYGGLNLEIVINMKGNKILLGYFDNSRKGAIIRDKYIIKNKLQGYKLQVLK